MTNLSLRQLRAAGVFALALWVLFTIFIFVWTILASLKTTFDIFAHVWSLPALPMQFVNYAHAWISASLATAARNSILVVGTSTLVILALSAPAAYGLSRGGFRGAGFLTSFFAIGIGIPVQVVLIPLFLMLSGLHLIDSLVGLALVYVSLSLPFTTFLLTGFFRTLPSELEEAATIDGASRLQTFRLVMLPLAMPGLITAAILNVVGLWNEFLLAYTFINTNDNFTMPLGIVNMYSALEHTSDWAGLFAGIVIVVVPILFLYLWLSNRIIEGLTLGSGK